MKISQITVANYRNLKSQTVALDAGLNVFVGDNAQGKTNLVESVYLCCIGKSPRAEKDRDLICWKQQNAYVKVDYASRLGKGDISVELTDGDKKKICVDGAPIAKTGDLMGYLNCIYFSPNEIRIISEGPAERRRFLDVDLCQTDKNYFYSLLRHNKALVQRNNVLKQSATLEEAENDVFAWDQIIAKEGAQVIYKRKNFCQKLKGLAKASHEKLTEGKESLTLTYLTKIKGDTVEDLERNYLAALQESLTKDFEQRHTNVGCQRDDVMLKINGVDVRGFGSQGQMRTTALSLKLAELTLFKEMLGEYPVLILDDVLSELDPDRQKQLLNFDEDLQILLTSATGVEEKLLAKHRKLFQVKDGVCLGK